MSVDNYKFRCDNCGHTEIQCEDTYLFSDECYEMLQCPHCKKVRSIKLKEHAIKAKDYPLCPDCNVKMTEWDKMCPECDTAMKVIGWFSDTI